MSQQVMRGRRRGARRWMPKAVPRKQRADRERWVEGLVVAVLTVLGERDAAVRDAERRGGEALETMTNDEGPSLQERSSGAAVAA
jgi:hypothetical protein